MQMIPLEGWWLDFYKKFKSLDVTQFTWGIYNEVSPANRSILRQQRPRTSLNSNWATALFQSTWKNLPHRETEAYKLVEAAGDMIHHYWSYKIYEIDSATITAVVMVTVSNIFKGLEWIELIASKLITTNMETGRKVV